uniref:hypothetical protein n=1 Tax=Nocardia carnea TaxID=37328 RepID=UPI0024572558
MPAHDCTPTSEHSEFDVENRNIEVHLDETHLARMIEEQYDTQDWPDTDEQWRKRWLDTVAGLLDHVNRCDGLLTMSTPARW